MKVELIDLRDRFKEEGRAILKIVKKVLSKGNLILTQEVNILVQNIVLD